MAAGRDLGSDDADLRALQDLLGPRRGSRRQDDPRQAPAAGHDGGADASSFEAQAPDGVGEEATVTGTPDAAGPAPAPSAAEGVARGPGAAPVAQEANGADDAVQPDAPRGPDTGRRDSEEAPRRAQGARHDDAPEPAQRPAWAMARTDVIEAERAPHHALSPLDPAIGLADRLQADRLLSVPVRPWPRVVAAALSGVFLVLWVLALRASALGRPWPNAGWPASVWFFVLAIVAAGAFAGMIKLWPARELRLSLAPNQHEQFARIEAQARAMQRLVWIGAAGAVAGLVLLAAGFGVVPPGGLGVVLALGSLLAAGGLVSTVVGLARWLPMRMLYVQTLVLQRLEALGLGDQLAMDPRTANVILALDGLLGKLPESAVRQFLSRPEAEWYLELVGQLKGGRGGR